MNFFKLKSIIETAFQKTHENLLRNLQDCLSDKTFDSTDEQR